MTNQEVNDYLDKKREGYEYWAKYYGFDYNKELDRIVSDAFEDGCNFAYQKAIEEFGGKDMNAIMHKLMIDNIIEAIRKHHAESIELKDSIGFHVGAIQCPDGHVVRDYGKVQRITINGDHLIFEVPEKGFIMQNELSVLDLMHIYQYIPIHEGW